MMLLTLVTFYLTAVSYSFTTKQTIAFYSKKSAQVEQTSLLMSLSTSSEKYTIADQPARFARAQKENNERYLDIEKVYDPSYIKGKRVAVTGCNRGIGLALAEELKTQGAKIIALCRSTSPMLEKLEADEVVLGLDVTCDEECDKLASKIKGG